MLRLLECLAAFVGVLVDFQSGRIITLQETITSRIGRSLQKLPSTELWPS